MRDTRRTGVPYRQFTLGRNRIQERATLIEGSTGPSNPGPCDRFYYALRELDTVTALLGKNGALVEAYSYDGYGCCVYPRLVRNESPRV